MFMSMYVVIYLGDIVVVSVKRNQFHTGTKPVCRRQVIYWVGIKIGRSYIIEL